MMHAPPRSQLDMGQRHGPTNCYCVKNVKPADGRRNSTCHNRSQHQGCIPGARSRHGSRCGCWCCSFYCSCRRGWLRLYRRVIPRVRAWKAPSVTSQMIRFADTATRERNSPHPPREHATTAHPNPVTARFFHRIPEPRLHAVPSQPTYSRACPHRLPLLRSTA